jgi:hypothetical protein
MYLNVLDTFIVTGVCTLFTIAIMIFVINMVNNRCHGYRGCIITVLELVFVPPQQVRVSVSLLL